MNIENKLKLATTAIAIVGLFFGVYKFLKLQELEATKPYLEKKLAWCEEAVETASFIATANEPTAVKEQRFWQMYYGILGLVEKRSIEAAMVAFGAELGSNRNSSEPLVRSKREALARKSLALSHACRKELAMDWSSSWQKP